MTSGLHRLAEEITAEIVARVQLNDVSCPSPRGPWAYYHRTVDGLEHDIVCRRPVEAPPPSSDPSRPDAYEVVILDENTLAAEHEYLWIAETALSPSQRLWAYAADLTGSELMTVRIRDIEQGRDLDEVIEGAYFGLAFAGDHLLFYVRPDHAMRGYQAWCHEVGTDPTQDRLLWQEEDERFELGLDATKDGAYVVLVSESTSTSECRLVSAAVPESEPLTLLGRRRGVKYSVEHHRGALFVLSNDAGPNFELSRGHLGPTGLEDVRVLLRHRPDVRLAELDVIDGHAIVVERGHATTSLRILRLAEIAEATLDSDPTRPLPGLVISAPPAGMIALSGNLDFEATDVRYVSTTLVSPPATHAVDATTGVTKVVHREAAPGFDERCYRTELRWATSSDGTRVPLTLAWHRERPAGPGPCLLYGYGAYEASSDPAYEQDWPLHPLLDRNVLYAIAHVRGGGELGRPWYEGGRLEQKHHSFEDFVACARHLCDEGWTTPDQLAAQGGSAGGLLMGASVNLDPNLFAAIVAEVPFVDCVTTMLDPSIPLTVPEQEEWGDPAADPAAYAWMKAYSPYDNVRAERYPRMLVTTGINDPRVMYFEPAKWVQKLRGAHPDNNDRVLLRVEFTSGHHGPSGRYHAWRQRAFVLAFVADAIGAGGSASRPGPA
jgi:oligopeptidase B